MNQQTLPVNGGNRAMHQGEKEPPKPHKRGLRGNLERIDQSMRERYQEEKHRLQAVYDEHLRPRDVKTQDQERVTPGKSVHQIQPTNVIPRIPLTTQSHGGVVQSTKIVQALPAAQAHGYSHMNMPPQYILVPHQQIIQEKPTTTRTVVVEEFIIPGTLNLPQTEILAQASSSESQINTTV